MPTTMIFQYVAPGSLRPDDITLTDQKFPVNPDTVIPNVGDFVTFPIAYGNDGADRGKHKKFKVAAKHFSYTLENPSEGNGNISETEIYIILTDSPGREVGHSFKE